MSEDIPFINRGDPIRADWLNMGVEALRRTPIGPSPDILPQNSPRGTTLLLARRYRKDVEDFVNLRVESVDALKVRVRSGYVLWGAKTLQWLDDPEALPFDIPESVTDYKVWLALDSAFAPTALTVEHGQDGWAGYPAQPDAPNKYVELARVNTSDKAITKITYLWAGGDLVWPMPMTLKPVPWVIFQHAAATPDPTSDWRTFRVHRGFVNDSHPDNDAEETTPLDIVVPASTTNYTVWLKTTFQNQNDNPGLYDSKAAIVSCTIEASADGWPTFPTTYDFTGLPSIVRYDLIGYIATGVDSPADDGGDPPTANPDFHSVNILQNLTENIFIPVNGNLFPVVVSNDGGSDGDASTAASYTYTVSFYAYLGSFATGVPLARPRPLGKMTPGSGTGLAFWHSDGAIKLWDAGEIPVNALCVDPPE